MAATGQQSTSMAIQNALQQHQTCGVLENYMVQTLSSKGKSNTTQVVDRWESGAALLCLRSLDWVHGTTSVESKWKKPTA